MRGLVAPHIDFTRGGAGYAWAYRALAEARDADCFIVLGTSHQGLDGHHFAATRKAFETPFGPLEVDHEILDAIVRRSPEDLFAAELAHRGEHSIEFQAVWLEYLRHRTGGGARRIVPLLTSFVHECLARGESPAAQADVGAVLDAVSDAMATIPRRYCIVAGADLAHVGPRFGDGWRAGRTQLARVQSEDRALLAPVSAGDAEGFFQEALRQGRPEPDLRPVADLLPPSAAPARGGHAPPLRAVARSRRRGHLRQRRLRADGAASMTQPPPSGPGVPAEASLSGAFRIDREGAWRHEEVEVTHPGVLRNLYANLRVDGTGHYLQAGPFRVPVQVDDAPFVVVRAQTDDPRAIDIHLSDGSRETLDASDAQSRRARHSPLPRQGRAVPGPPLRGRVAPARREGRDGPRLRRARPGPGRPPSPAPSASARRLTLGAVRRVELELTALRTEVSVTGRTGNNSAGPCATRQPPTARPNPMDS